MLAQVCYRDTHTRLLLEVRSECEQDHFAGASKVIQFLRGCMNKKKQAEAEVLAIEFRQIDDERLELERRCRFLKKRLQVLQAGLQEFVGTADVVNVPLVSRIGKFFITQVRKHRFVEAYECDFIEFKVVDSESSSN